MSWLGVCVVSERACSLPAPARCGYRAIPGRGDQPSRRVRFRSSRCRRLWSARVRCGDVSRTKARSALSCTGVHGPPGACARAHSAAAAAISRHAAAAAGVGAGAPRSTWSSLRLRRRCPSGAEPGARRPGVRVPRAPWHERRPARPGASPRSPRRRDVTAPWGVAIAAATRVDPGADAGRRQPDTLGRRIAADGRGRSASPLQRCMRHSGLNPDRRRAASRRRHRASSTCRTNTCNMRRPLPWLDIARIGSSMPLRPNAYQ